MSDVQVEGEALIRIHAVSLVDWLQENHPEVFSELMRAAWDEELPEVEAPVMLFAKDGW